MLVIEKAISIWLTVLVLSYTYRMTTLDFIDSFRLEAADDPEAETLLISIGWFAIMVLTPIGGDE